MRDIDQIGNIVATIKAGGIDYETGKSRAMPIIERMNKRAREIAKKHGVRPKLFSWGTFIRHF